MKSDRQKGVTIVEILLSMSIGLVLMFICAEVLINAVRLNRIAQEELKMQYTAQAIRNILTQDLHRAGFYTSLLEGIEIKGSAKLKAFQPSCKGGDDSFAHMLFPKVFGLNSEKQHFECLENHLQGSDILSIKYMQPVHQVDTRTSARHNLYLKANLYEASLFKAKDRNNIRNQLSSSAENKESLFELHSRIYYVRNTGRSCANNKIYGLYREYSNHKSYMMSEEVASGVQQFQVQFWVKNQKKHAHDIAIDEWSEVEAVSIDLLLQAECQEAMNYKPRRFDLADISFFEEDPVRFQRAHFQFYIALRN